MAKVGALSRQLVGDRLQRLGLTWLTLDFGGSVIHTQRHVEGSVVGYCKAKKGARSYYPLFCTVAQTGQGFDVLHQAGECPRPPRRAGARDRLPGHDHDPGGVELMLSVPFECFVALKERIEARRRWRRITGGFRLMSAQTPVGCFEDQGSRLD